MTEIPNIHVSWDTKREPLTRGSANQLGENVLDGAQQVVDDAVAHYLEFYNDLHTEQPDLTSYELHRAIMDAPRYVDVFAASYWANLIKTPIINPDYKIVAKVSFVEYMIRTVETLRSRIRPSLSPQNQGVSSTLSRYIQKVSKLARVSEMKMLQMLDSSSLVGSRHGTSIISLIDSEGEEEFAGVEEKNNAPASLENEVSSIYGTVSRSYDDIEDT